jgi:hypothetical protein
MTKRTPAPMPMHPAQICPTCGVTWAFPTLFPAPGIDQPCPQCDFQTRHGLPHTLRGTVPAAPALLRRD